tara:strand:- start:419 stop:610 length:192 start_codon:yes stop_codon:yes gene_type:complete
MAELPLRYQRQYLVFGREVRHQVNVVGYKRIIIEMMFDRPQTVEVGIGAKSNKPKSLLPHLLI